MSIIKTKKKLLSLLENHKQLIVKQKMSRIPSNYAELQQAAFVKELEDEIEKLSDIFSNEGATIESLQNEFRELCIQRDQQNQNTCLSFTALPEGVCNRLYIDIATMLFKPNQLAEMLALLMPGIKECLTVEISDFLSYKMSSSQPAVERVQVALQPKPMSSLATHAFESSKLTEVITGDNAIFMLASVERFPLPIHRKIYNLLGKFPTIKQKLYQHNDDFKQLLFDISLLEKNGLTANDVLTNFVNELTRSGNRYTGNIFAANSVIQACVQFREYIDQLPEELRKELLALRTPDQQYSLQKIVDEHLAQGDCVEQAASRIKLIQENQHNKGILAKRPYVTEEQFNKLKTKYRKPLSITGYEATKVLPKALRKTVLKNIRITSASDYIDLFINLPPSEYVTFLTDAKITCVPALPEELGAVLEMLDEEQQAAFLEILITQREKFGGIEEVMRFCVKHKITTVLSQALKLIPPHKLTKIIRKRESDNISLLHHAIKTGTPDIFQMLWECLTKPEQLNIITEQDEDEKTALYYATMKSHPEIFNTLWNCLSEKDQLATLQAKNSMEKNLLLYAATNQNLIAFKTMWKHLSEEEKLIEIYAKDIWGYTLLHRAALSGNPEIVALICECLTKNEKAFIIQVKNHYNETPLHIAAQNPNPDFFKVLWECLTEQEQLTAIQAKEVDERTPLHSAAVHNRSGFAGIWETFSEQTRLIAINEKDKYGLTPLFYAISNNAANFTLMWNCLSSKDRVNAIRGKSNAGNTLLHKVIEEKNLDILISLLENAETSDLLTKNNEGFHPLRNAISTPEIFKRLWERLSPQEQRFVMQDKQNGFLLHKAIQNSNPQTFFIIWESLSEEEKRQACLEEAENGSTLLRFAAQKCHPDVWQVIWNEYSEDERFSAINKKAKGSEYTLLHWALQNSNPIIFRTVLAFIPQQDQLHAIYEKDSEGKSILYSAAINEKPDYFRIIWKGLSAEERQNAIREKNANGESLLVSAARFGNFFVFRTLLECLSEQELAAALSEKNTAGKSLLNWIEENRNGEKFLAIWERLSSQQRLAVISEKNNTGMTLLEQFAKATSSIFDIVWNHLSQHEPSLVNSQGNRVLYWALIGNIQNNFFSIWKSLSPEDRLTALLKTDENDKTLLHLAMPNNRRIFNTLWKFLSKQDRLLMLEKKNKVKNTLLHFAIQHNNPEIFYTLWKCLPEQQQSNASKEKTANGSNYLHFAAQKSHPEIWQIIWNLYSAEERKEAIFGQQRDTQNTLLHWAIKGGNIKAVQTILEFLPEQDRLNTLLLKNTNGLSPLDSATHDTALFSMMWKCLPQSDRLKITQSDLANDSNLLQIIASNSNASNFKAVWELYSETERLVIIRHKIKNKDMTILQFCIEGGYYIPLSIILNSLSGQDRLSIILDKDNKGNTLLNSLAQSNKPFTTQTILQSLSEPNRVIVLKEKNQLGDTPLHYLAAQNNIEILRIILRFVPAEELFALLTEKDERGNTPLHLAAQNTNPLIWFTMIEYLSEEDRLRATEECCACGYTPLQRAAENSNPDILRSILQSYPESKRLKAIEMLDAWERMTCSKGVSLEIVRNENKKLQESSLHQIEAFNTRKAAPKVSALGLFSPLDGAPEGNPLTPLQSSLSEGFVCKPRKAF